MSACLKTIINEWAIPRMKVATIMGSVFVGNEGSRAVFRKNGFEFVGVVEKGSMELPPQKGGPGRKDLWVMRWVRKVEGRR
jgi:RimJ/RimL family protein N-acetyltransferase